MIDPNIRLRVSQAKKSLITNWGEGVFIEAQTGQTVTQLLHRATVDRFELSLDFRRRSRQLLSPPANNYRDAVSRLYYAMYHAARAVVFFTNGGDDNQDHQVLPGNIPGDFPNTAIWANRLKTARDNRNRADYDPFPKGPAFWRALASSLSNEVDEFIVVARQYLRGKGCTGI